MSPDGLLPAMGEEEEEVKTKFGSPSSLRQTNTNTKIDHLNHHHISRAAREKEEEHFFGIICSRPAGVSKLFWTSDPFKGPIPEHPVTHSTMHT